MNDMVILWIDDLVWFRYFRIEILEFLLKKIRDSYRRNYFDDGKFQSSVQLSLWKLKVIVF